MGDYLKLFETHAEYQAYSGGGEMILPNVSYCEDNKCVHYNPLIRTVKLFAMIPSDGLGYIGVYNYDTSIFEIMCDSQGQVLRTDTSGRVQGVMSYFDQQRFETLKAILIYNGYNATNYSLKNTEYNFNSVITDFSDYTRILPEGFGN